MSRRTQAEQELAAGHLDRAHVLALLHVADAIEDATGALRALSRPPRIIVPPTADPEDSPSIDELCDEACTILAGGQPYTVRCILPNTHPSNVDHAGIHPTTDSEIRWPPSPQEPPEASPYA